jgi:hypothetical protein
MNRKYSLILTVVVLILFTSCFKIRTRFPVYYNVINNTNSRVTVFYKVKGGFPALLIYPEVRDSIASIAPHQRTSLFVQIYDDLNEFHIEKTDSIYMLDTLLVFKDDTIPSTKNFLQKKYWDFLELNNAKAEYNLSIDANAFMP